jgi:hypothetical protein
LPARAVFCSLILAAALAGALVTAPDQTRHAVAYMGADWAHLLRAMAALKVLMAATTTAAVLWRLGSAIRPRWLAAYTIAAAAMAAGPGLIWGLAHIPLGALLLHAGLVATLLLLWRDKEVGARLAALVAAKRAALRG